MITHTAYHIKWKNNICTFHKKNIFCYCILYTNEIKSTKRGKVPPEGEVLLIITMTTSMTNKCLSSHIVRGPYLTRVLILAVCVEFCYVSFVIATQLQRAVALPLDIACVILCIVPLPSVVLWDCYHCTLVILNAVPFLWCLVLWVCVDQPLPVCCPAL